MKLSFLQKGIIDSLKVSPKITKELVEEFGVTYQTVRSAILTLEAGGYIERNEKFVPHQFSYKAPESNGAAVDQKLVDKVKHNLINPEENKNKASVIYPLFYETPKEDWPDLAILLEIAVAAVRQLNDEGKLITTLDPKDLT